MMSNQEIIVLGGGLVGKTAALTFAQKGFKVFHIASSLAPKNSAGAQSLVDPAWQSRVFAISTSSQQLLQQLQVWDALPQERIQVVSDMRIFGDEAHIDRSLHFSAFEAGVPQLSWIVEASLIEHGLDLASRFCQTLTRVEAEVLDIKMLERGVQVCTDHGNFGAQVIIAADGANSPTRTHFGIEISNENYVHSAVVANLECSQAHLQTAYQWFLPGGDVLALLPLPGQRASLVWSTQHENAQSLVNCANTEPEAFCQRIAQAAQGMVTHELGSLRLLNLAQSYPLRKLRAKRLIGPSVDPKIILVGDSAHAMHPIIHACRAQIANIKTLNTFIATTLILIVSISRFSFFQHFIFLRIDLFIFEIIFFSIFFRFIANHGVSLFFVLISINNFHNYWLIDNAIIALHYFHF